MEERGVNLNFQKVKHTVMILAFEALAAELHYFDTDTLFSMSAAGLYL